jgi:hypothetical protein
MKKRVTVIIAIFMVAIIFASCGSKQARDSVTETSKSDQLMQENPSSDNKVAADYDSTTPAYTERKIIQNARVILEVKDTNESYDKIEKKVISSGGYVSASDIGSNYSHITIRVPATSLGNILSFLDTVGDRKERNTSTDDITEEYTDTKARLKNLKAQEEQLLGIMKKANTIEDILKVQGELYKVRGDIEAFEGKIKMWDKLVEFSTIDITLNKAKEISGKNVKLTFISWNEIGKAMANGFKSTLNVIIRFFSTILVFIVTILPLIPFIALAVWIFIRFRKK